MRTVYEAHARYEAGTMVGIDGLVRPLGEAFGPGFCISEVRDGKVYLIEVTPIPGERTCDLEPAIASPRPR